MKNIILVIVLFFFCCLALMIIKGQCVMAYEQGYRAAWEDKIAHLGYKNITEWVGIGNESGRSYWWSK